MQNTNITVEDIQSHPEYPWIYEEFINPTIEYAIKHNQDISIFAKSYRILPIQLEHFHWNSYYMNPNLTLDDIKEKDYVDTSSCLIRINTPYLIQKYRTLYSNIILEIKYNR